MKIEPEQYSLEFSNGGIAGYAIREGDIWEFKPNILIGSNYSSEALREIAEVLDSLKKVL